VTRQRPNIASVIFVGALVIAITLVVILLRNPATHANLEAPEYYDRTELAYLEKQYVYPGFGHGVGVGDGTDITGRLLFVRVGCIGCHGEFAQGGAVGGALWDLDEEDFARDVRDGPSGMPAYPEETLSNEDLEEIRRFLLAVPAEAATFNVTTATTTLPPPQTTTVVQPTTTQADPGTPGETTVPPSTQPPEPIDLTLEAPAAAITVDGDADEWDAIEGLELTLEPIVGEEAPPHAAGVKVAHDETHIYVLFWVEDDYNWSTIDPHFAGAPAVMWPVESTAGPHMGGDDPSGHPGLGMVDVWYWRLECPIGAEQGGAVSGPGSGDPGNDDECNFDDEWATDPEVHEDDVGPGAENSLLGVFSHTNPVEDQEGTWYFEMSRPLETGDPQDAQFAVGSSTRLALAYWDPDAGQNGWGRRDHVQSSNLGWIGVLLTE
jgi:hypothetical protein